MLCTTKCFQHQCLTFLVSNIAFLFCLISLSSCLHYTRHDQSFLSRFCLYGTVWCGVFFVCLFGFFFWDRILPEEMVSTVVSSVLRFQECSALPGHFLHFSPMYFQLPFSSLSFSFSNFHNLYKYYSMFMFFIDFTSIISSSSPLTFFVACVCLLVYVVVLCACACGRQRTVFIVGFQLLSFSLRQDLIDLELWQVDSVSTALRLQVCTGFCMGSGELAKYFTNWGIN